MITRDDLMQIGQIVKPHGLQGEVAFTFTSDIFDETEPPCFICELDGIFVPFFIESYRFKNDETALVKFEGVNSADEAKELILAELAGIRERNREIRGEIEFDGIVETNASGYVIRLIAHCRERDRGRLWRRLNREMIDLNRKLENH